MLIFPFRASVAHGEIHHLDLRIERSEVEREEESISFQTSGLIAIDEPRMIHAPQRWERPKRPIAVKPGRWIAETIRRSDGRISYVDLKHQDADDGGLVVKHGGVVFAEGAVELAECDEIARGGDPANGFSRVPIRTLALFETGSIRVEVDRPIYEPPDVLRIVIEGPRPTGKPAPTVVSRFTGRTVQELVDYVEALYALRGLQSPLAAFFEAHLHAAERDAVAAGFVFPPDE